MTTVMSPLSALLMTIDVSLRKSNRAFLSLGVRLSVVCCAFSTLRSCSISFKIQLSREVERRDAVHVYLVMYVSLSVRKSPTSVLGSNFLGEGVGINDVPNAKSAYSS